MKTIQWSWALVILCAALNGCSTANEWLDRVASGTAGTGAALTEEEAVQRRAFALLRQLRDAGERAGHALPELSMGMSGDYGPAVEEGATIVRLGTVLFGERS